MFNNFGIRKLGFRHCYVHSDQERSRINETAGLPDGIFFKPRIPIWQILEGLSKEGVGLFYSHLVYFMAIGVFCGHLVYLMVIWYTFSTLWYVVPRKIWQPWEQSVPASSITASRLMLHHSKFPQKTRAQCYDHNLLILEPILRLLNLQLHTYNANVEVC
jgi:hypothetical protein